MSRNVGDVLKDLNRLYGESTNVWKATDDMIIDDKAASTGSPILDCTINPSTWALPSGLIQFCGAPSSGKTLLSLSVIKEAQKDPNAWCLFIDAEFSHSKKWMEQIGLSLDRLLILPENNGRIIFERLVGVPEPKKSGKSKPGLLDLELAEPSGLKVIVLDSIATIQVPLEEHSVVGKMNIAPLSRFLPAELRRLVPLLYKTGVVFICINQIRIDPGVMYGSPERTTGGNSLAHAQRLCINFAQLGGKDNLIVDLNTKETIGHTIRAKITKSKIAPGRDKKVMFDILYTKGIVNKHKDAVELALRYGIIERPSKISYIYNGETFKGRDNLIEHFEDKPELVEEIINKCKAIARGEEEIPKPKKTPSTKEDLKPKKVLNAKEKK